jgi:hypothetical protein
MHLRPWAAGQTSRVTRYRIACRLTTNDRCGLAAVVVACRPKASFSSDPVAPPSCASPSLRHTYLIAAHLLEVSNVVEMVPVRMSDNNALESSVFMQTLSRHSSK